MKFSEKWLREWVNPSLNTEQLTDQLTMAGFELESVVSTAPNFQNVVVGEVISAEQHPNADRLRHCKVNVGQSQPLEIVCGGPNVRTGLKVAVVLIGGRVGELQIKKTTLRGVDSHGMICSERELGLSDNQDGNILELPADAPIGMDFSHYLNLDDHIIDIAITPNRGDCLSIRGIAREVAALNHLPIESPQPASVASKHNETFKVKVLAPNECPRYLGRVIRNIKNNAHTPIWMRERLRRSGLRCVHPVVDVMNYVMLEQGQPLHAFDLEKLNQEIQIRLAKAGEKITLLDGKEVSLTAETLVVADQHQVHAIAGIMGAASSAVQTNTQHLFLESAFFTPGCVALTARRMGLHSESANRFERGVDFELQKTAIERATELLLKIVGGEAGPIIEICSNDFLPKRAPVVLRRPQIQRLLGITIEDKEVTQIFTALGMKVIHEKDCWEVKVPSYRFDISNETDLIEELARLHGYVHIPAAVMISKYTIPKLPEAQLSLSRIRRLLVDRSYHEIITFSFIDETLCQQLNPQLKFIPLANPITREMNVMRTSLWPGLINVLRYNEHRQVSRVRLFEVGMCFWVDETGQWQQVTKLAGLIAGDNHDLQWAEGAKPVDFYDVKGDVCALLALTRTLDTYRLAAGSHPALHPGQCAAIYRQDRLIGHVGALHPQLADQLELKSPPLLFEMELDGISTAKLPKYQPISRFPLVRRDIALIVDRELEAEALQKNIVASAGRLLNKVEIFDIYVGEGIESGKKSVALGLTFQDPSRTLIDEEINQVIERVVTDLGHKFNAKLRA